MADNDYPEDNSCCEYGPCGAEPQAPSFAIDWAVVFKIVVVLTLGFLVFTDKVPAGALWWLAFILL